MIYYLTTILILINTIDNQATMPEDFIRPDHLIINMKDNTPVIIGINDIVVDINHKVWVNVQAQYYNNGRIYKESGHVLTLIKNNKEYILHIPRSLQFKWKITQEMPKDIVFKPITQIYVDTLNDVDAK